MLSKQLFKMSMFREFQTVAAIQKICHKPKIYAVITV